MKKKLILLLGLTLVLLVLAVLYFDREKLVPRQISDERLWKVYQHYDEGCKEATLIFEDYVPAYDEESDTYFVVQDLSVNRWEGMLTAENAKVYSLEDPYWDMRAEAVAEGHVFDLIFMDNDNEEYRMTHVVFTGMPVLSIETTMKDAGTLAREDAESWYGRFTLDSIKDGHQTTKASFRRRGATSYGLPQYGIRIELEEKFELLGMRYDDDWQLNALYDDLGLIHNDLSFELWNQMAVSNSVEKDAAVDEAYLEVFIDDEYMGVYLLQERYDAKKAQVSEGDVIYKSWGFDYPESVDTVTRFVTQKYPDEITEETLSPLWDWCRAFWAAEEFTYEDALNLIEYDNTIDYTLFLDLTAATDNMRKNIYYVARQQADGSWRITCIPWDLNMTWGINFTETENGYGLGHTDLTELEGLRFTGVWGLMDMNCGVTGKDLWERWNYLRDNTFSEGNIRSILDEKFDYLHSSGAYDRHYAKWPECRNDWSDDLIYEFVGARLNYLDDFYQDYMENPYTYY